MVKPILLFDAECGLCNFAVQWFIRHDKPIRILFLAQNSASAKQLLEQQAVTHRTPTVILWENGKVYTYSEAVLRASAYLDKPWSFLQYLRVLPRFLRDTVYRLIAKYRHRIWGNNACLLPDASTQQRFVSEQQIKTYLNTH